LIGSLVAPSSSSRSETFSQPADSSFGIQLETIRDLHLRKAAQRAWADLPYTMMGLTEACRAALGPRPYWRDQKVQLGEIELSLLSIVAVDGASTYRATYTRDGCRRTYTLRPSFEGNELCWSAPDLSNGVRLTTQQLAAKLLRKLVRFYVRSLSAPVPTSSASPGHSS
jgi:hypothetical protein